MNSQAEYWYIIQEMWRTEPSQWGDDFAFRLANSLMDINLSVGEVDIINCWDTNFSKKEFWRRAEATKKQLLKEFDSNQEKYRLFNKWVYKNIFGGDYIPG